MGGHHGFIEKFLSHRTETKNVVGEPFCVSENIWYGKNFMGRRCWGGGGRGGGGITSSVETFKAHSVEKNS